MEFFFETFQRFRDVNFLRDEGDFVGINIAQNSLMTLRRDSGKLDDAKFGLEQFADLLDRDPVANLTRLNGRNIFRSIENKFVLSREDEMPPGLEQLGSADSQQVLVR